MRILIIQIVLLLFMNLIKLDAALLPVAPEFFMTEKVRVKRQAGYVYNKPSVAFNLPMRAPTEVPTTTTQAPTVDRTLAQMMYYAYPVPPSPVSNGGREDVAYASRSGRMGNVVTSSTGASRGGYSYEQPGSIAGNHATSNMESNQGSAGINSQSAGSRTGYTYDIPTTGTTGMTSNSGGSQTSSSTTANTASQINAGVSYDHSAPAPVAPVDAKVDVSTNAPQYLPPSNSDGSLSRGGSGSSSDGPNAGYSSDPSSGSSGDFSGGFSGGYSSGPLKGAIGKFSEGSIGRASEGYPIEPKSAFTGGYSGGSSNVSSGGYSSGSSGGSSEGYPSGPAIESPGSYASGRSGATPESYSSGPSSGSTGATGYSDSSGGPIGNTGSSGSVATAPLLDRYLPPFIQPETQSLSITANAAVPATDRQTKGRTAAVPKSTYIPPSEKPPAPAQNPAAVALTNTDQPKETDPTSFNQNSGYLPPRRSPSPNTTPRPFASAQQRSNYLPPNDDKGTPNQGLILTPASMYLPPVF